MISDKEYNQHRRAAHDFFECLETHLNQRLKSPVTVYRHVEKVVGRANASTAKSDRGKRSREATFLKEYVFPCVHDFLTHSLEMQDEVARKALLAEGYKSCLNLARGSPGRFVGHPFGKVLGVMPLEIMARWKRGGRKCFPAGSFPDMALLSPFKTVFECKYFHKGDTEQGESVLVNGIYEACFYLGLSRFPAGSRGAAWDYEFACFLAGDASERGGLYKAWQNLSNSVKSGIWDGANTYVMIVRGRA